MYHYDFSGLSNVWVNGIQEYIDADGDHVIAVPSSVDMELLKMVTTKDSTINSEEVQYLRSACNKTQSELATIFGISVRTVQRWEQGTKQIDGAHDLRLRILAAQQWLPKKIVNKIVQLMGKPLKPYEEQNYYIDVDEIAKKSA